jgi:hypothetical protein
MTMFIFTLVLMASLSTVLYLVVQALPRIAEESDGGASPAKGWWVRSHIPEKIDIALDGFILKLLRKVKVAILKVDNAVSARLEKVKPAGNGKRSAIDFKEIAGQNKESQNGNA